MPAIRRSLAERAAARAVTGFLGHLYGGVADWLELAGRLGRQRVGRALRSRAGRRART